jgi:predicted GIY-YIG superfamily endonuclease
VVNLSNHEKKHIANPFALSQSKGERQRSAKNMSFRVYILRCADNSYYTGHTDNLEKRISEHQNGLCAGYTVGRLVELVFSQACTTREEALAAEQSRVGVAKKRKP